MGDILSQPLCVENKLFFSVNLLGQGDVYNASGTRVIISSGPGLLPLCCQAITQTKANLLLTDLPLNKMAAFHKTFP